MSLSDLRLALLFEDQRRHFEIDNDECNMRCQEVLLFTYF